MEDVRDDPIVTAAAVVDATPDEAWTAWATDAGLETFLAPDCIVVLDPLSPFEAFADADEHGVVGGEENHVLGFDPETMLHLTWRPPAGLRGIREMYTSVVVRFAPVDDRRTLVTVTHDGFGHGTDWAVARESAAEMWQRVVLPRLAHRFRHGPVDWDDPPPPV